MSSRVDPYPLSPVGLTCFSVSTDAESSTLARVVEVFAMRSVLPHRLHSVVQPAPTHETRPTGIRVEVQVAGLAPADAALIARNLSRLIGVRSVSTADTAGT